MSIINVKVGSKVMKSVFLVIVLGFVCVVVRAQQMSSLDFLQQTFKKQEQILLDDYGKSLDLLMTDLKKRVTLIHIW
jgi:hypothetical protein